jgi:hypothetical protein
MSFGATFLRAPDLFPGRNAGEPWGSSAFAVECAGGPYLFGGLLPEQAEGLARRFGAPARPPAGALAGPPAGAPTIEVRVFRAAASDFRRFDLRGFDNHLDLDHRPAAVRMAGLDLMARLDREPLRASLWTCATDGETFRGAAENLLRVVVAYRLLELGGVLLHSAALAAPGADAAGVHLFVGASGAGKSTLARLGVEAGLRPLSDDLNAVLPAAGGAAVAPLPFTGELAPPPPAPPLPLASIARLEKGDENRRRPLAPGALLASLAACAPYVNTDGERLDDLFGSLERLVAAVPGWVLSFRRDGGFHELLGDRPAAPAGRREAA